MNINDKIRFIEDYKHASNAATGSKYDSNSNVTDKNIAVMSWEVPKKDNIDLNRELMRRKLSELYGDKIAYQYLADLNSHIIYKHDETSLIPDYCASVSMYPFLLYGTTNLGGTSTAPKHLESFCGGFINLLFILASQHAGAIATVEFLMYFDHFMRVDYGEDYYKHVDEKFKIGNTEKSIADIIIEHFAQVVYSVNQPCAARGAQAIFWNISYFDKYYFKNLFDGFIFPDGDEPCWESTSWLQKFFMKWFNHERTKVVLTFPVETMNLLDDGTDIKDKEYKDFTAEMLSEGHSFFIYRSDTVDALASCCFDGDTKVLARDSKNGVRFMTFKEIYSIKSDDKPNFKIFHNGSWVAGKVIKTVSPIMYRIKTANDKEFILSGNHINPTLDGEKETAKLTTNDYLMFNTSCLESYHEADEHLTFDEGYVIGLYAGDGSSYLAKKEGHDFHFAQVSFHLNEKKNLKSRAIIERALNQLSIARKVRAYKQENNNLTMQVSSRSLYDFIKRFVVGNYAYDKRLSPEILLQSSEFRKGILAGLYDSDGGNTNRIYSCSYDLIESIEILLTSLGLNSKIETQDRRDEPIIIRGQSYNRNYIVYSIRWYERKNKRSMKDIYIYRNNSMYFKITEIEKLETEGLQEVYCFEMKDQDEPYFTLPSGLITHNCRLKNAITEDMKQKPNEFAYTLAGGGSVQTGSKGVITINFNRLIQLWWRNHKQGETLDGFYDYVLEILDRVHKYLTAFNEIVIDYEKSGLLPVYKAGYNNINKKYLTIGIQGFIESAEFIKKYIEPDSDMAINPNSKSYAEYANRLCKTIADSNATARTPTLRFNTEFVPTHFLWAR